MADSGDRLIDLADKLAEALGTAFPTVKIGEADHDLTVAWSANPAVKLEDSALGDPLLWVTDWSETLFTEQGMQCEEIVLLLTLQMKIPAPADEPVIVRALSKLMNDIARMLRPMDEAFYLALDDGGAACVKTERTAARNLASIAQDGLHYAEMVTTWRRY